MKQQTARKKKLSYIEARTLAQSLTDILAPLCEPGKCKIAGSVRRGREIVGDIEIVCLPKKAKVTAPGELLPTVQNLVIHYFNKEHHRRRGIKILKGGQRYLQVLVGSVQVDIFMPLASQWGRILAIRTGPKNFAIQLAQRWKQLGYKGIRGKLHPESGEGYQPDFPTEKSFFKFLNWNFIQPQKR